MCPRQNPQVRVTVRCILSPNSLRPAPKQPHFRLTHTKTNNLPRLISCSLACPSQKFAPCQMKLFIFLACLVSVEAGALSKDRVSAIAGPYGDGVTAYADILDHLINAPEIQR